MGEDGAFVITDRTAEYGAKLRGKYDEPGARELAWADAIRLAIAVVHDDCESPPERFDQWMPSASICS